MIHGKETVNRFSVFTLSELALLAATCLKPGRTLPLWSELQSAYHQKRDETAAALAAQPPAHAYDGKEVR